jgi:catechol 2,3-dioxygenase-like lactoylglutathione lyase family enzyme
MRGVALFIVGVVAGLAVSAVAQNQTTNTGIVGLNHVAVSVPDIDQAVTYYTKTMGFPEAFRVTSTQGQPLVFLQISRNTFLELQPANAQRPPGINHFGLQVENMAAVTAMFKARGANVLETRKSSTNDIISNVVGPNGVRIELSELPPDSLFRKAMDRWR